MLVLFALVVVASAELDLSVKLPLEEAEKLTGQDLVEYVRRHQNLFQVEESKEAEERMKYLMDTKYLVVPDDAPRMQVVQGDADEDLPEEFDARKAWPECADLIGRVRDQTRCGSCWAVSAASTMTDRLCVQSKGKIKLFLSDTDILSCCGKFCGYGCHGGYPIRAWKYIMRNGVCTGGPYGTKRACRPYAFHPCGNHKNQVYYGECPKQSYSTPECKQICQRGYPTPYKKDKYYAISAFMLPNDEKAIRRELMKNGPVQGSFDTYQDIKLYKGGIYKHTAGQRTGGHAIKIIGWGKERINGTDVPYWTIANSWNSDWGEGGFFRMIRGTNDCNLEQMVNAGMMKV